MLHRAPDPASFACRPGQTKRRAGTAAGMPLPLSQSFAASAGRSGTQWSGARHDIWGILPCQLSKAEAMRGQIRVVVAGLRATGVKSPRRTSTPEVHQPSGVSANGATGTVARAGLSQLCWLTRPDQANAAESSAELGATVWRPPSRALAAYPAL